MTEPKWLTLQMVTSLHSEAIAAFGGSPGVRDVGLLESALQRPQNLHAYGESPGLADLAAAYASGITHNHPFIDGNKRVALLVIRAFLFLNRQRFEAEEPDETAVMLELADGRVEDHELAAWIAANTEPMES